MEPARQKWSLTQEAFDGLLESLGPNREEAAARYLEIRRNLVRLFEWRGCATPDEYADEALNRCAKRISEGEPIEDVAAYSIGVARMLLREMGHGRVREAPIDGATEPWIMPATPEIDSERRSDCLRRCLNQLSAENRELILSWYEGEKREKIRNRKALETRFGVPSGALRMRALRLRSALLTGVEQCLQREGLQRKGANFL